MIAGNALKRLTYPMPMNCAVSVATRIGIVSKSRSIEIASQMGGKRHGAVVDSRIARNIGNWGGRNIENAAHDCNLQTADIIV
jgi:hypothetical protein